MLKSKRNTETGKIAVFNQSNLDPCHKIPRGGGGGVHKHFFDRDARPRTDFNYPKKYNAPKFKPKKIE